MKISIKTILIFGVITLILGTVTIIMSYSYWRTQTALNQLLKNILVNISDYSIDKTESFLLPATQSSALTRRLIQSKLLAEGNRKQLAQFFYHQLSLHDQFAGMYLARPNGEFIYVKKENSSFERGFRTKLITLDRGLRRVKLLDQDADFREQAQQFDPSDKYDPRTRPWYQLAKDKKGIIWTDPYVFFSSQLPGITTARRIENKDGKLIAIVGIDIELGELSSFISALTIGKRGKALIVNQKGAMIAYSASDFVEQRSMKRQPRNLNELSDSISQQAFQPLFQEKKGYHLDQDRFTKFDFRGGTYHALLKPIQMPGRSWIFGIYIPERDFLQEIHESQAESMLIAFLISLLAVLLAIWFSAKITASLKILQRESELIKRFDLSTDVTVETVFSEIQDLADSFFRMKMGLKAFRHYVPISLVRSIIAKQQLPDREMRNMVVMFTDIEDFTQISEHLPPRILVEYLNDYLEVISRIVMRYQGTIDKYIGDSVMALWGIPVNRADATELACEAALKIQSRLEVLNATWAQQNRPIMKTRIGIVTGDMIVGNIGSSERISYTVIGDQVNLASRLEDLNKDYGTWNLISEETKEQLDSRFVTRFLDEVIIRGREQKTRVYELVGLSQTVSAETKEIMTLYEEAVEFYLEGQFIEAEQLLLLISSAETEQQDPPTQILLEKIRKKIAQVAFAQDDTGELTALE
ncbi:MAG: hypothetical protein COB67_11285 [SAR324 cluster bacterium]|uniref:Guanylate cyclase domain-containing protein n=1 Tax=SAR324 cluster bacterium TaxID=2024889 RepID=A0A2A4SU70_9DELT|nr:MAG: hypothetical protein COB67_11285 [SAR324 cluster bacterium]